MDKNNNLIDKNIPSNFEKNDFFMKLLDVIFSSNKNFEILSQNPQKIFSIEFLNKILKESNSQKNTANFIKDELFKFYFNELYNTTIKVKNSEKLDNYFRNLYEKLGIEKFYKGIDFDVNLFFKDESLFSSKEIKAIKGTLKGFYYIFDILNKINLQKLNGGENSNFLVVEELGNFKYRIKTNYFKEVVEETFIPLNHPVGLGYEIISLIYLKLKDNIEHISNKEIKKLDLICLKSNKTEIIDLLHYKNAEIKSYKVFSNEEGQHEIILDFYPEDPNKDDSENGFRILKNFNNIVSILNRQDGYVVKSGEFKGEKIYNEISELFFNEEVGEIEPIYVNKTILGVKYKVLKGFYFKGYTIQNPKSVKVKFTILKGIPEKIYESEIPVDLTVSSDKKYFIPIFISRKDIIKNAKDFDGRLLKNFENCKVLKEIEIQYSKAIKEKEFKKIDKKTISDDYECKENNFSNIGRIIIGKDIIKGVKKKITEELNFDFKFLVSGKINYTYNTFKDGTLIGDFDLKIGEKFVGGYQINKEVQAEQFKFDYVNGSKIEIFKDKKEIQEKIPKTIDLKEKIFEIKEISDNFNFEEDNYSIIGKAVFGKNIIYGKKHKTKEDFSFLDKINLTNEIKLYKYNTFKNGFIIGNSKTGLNYFKGENFEKYIKAEIFKFDYVNGSKIEIFKDKKEIQENYKEVDTKIENFEIKEISDNFNFEEDNYSIIGKAVFGKNIIYGKKHKVTDEFETLIEYCVFQGKLYKYNTFENGLVIGGTEGLIGERKIKGDFTETFVDAEVFDFDANNSDDFSFGVFKDGVKLEDNNISALQ